MEFIETSIFTKKILQILSEESYRKFQNELIKNPEKVKLIKGGEGLRKIRWGLLSKGKSGGVRVIYYYKKIASKIFLLLAYTKNEITTLSAEQTSQLSKLLKEL